MGSAEGPGLGSEGRRRAIAETGLPEKDSGALFRGVRRESIDGTGDFFPACMRRMTGGNPTTKAAMEKDGSTVHAASDIE